MTDERYNGWSNWSTWNVNLWLANEEPLYRDVVRMANRATDADELAGEIEQYVRGLADENGGKFGDLDAPGEYDAVDWVEVAESWLED